MIAALNSVIVFFYYFGVVRPMWFGVPAVGDQSPIRVPPTLVGAIALMGAVVLVVGVYPELFARIGERAF